MKCETLRKMAVEKRYAVRYLMLLVLGVRDLKSSILMYEVTRKP